MTLKCSEIKEFAASGGSSARKLIKKYADECEEARLSSISKYLFLWRMEMNSGNNIGCNKETKATKEQRLELGTIQGYFGKVTSLPSILWTRLIQFKRGAFGN